MNTSVDNYFINGCGRCELGGTPDCKVHSFSEELNYLRDLLLSTALEETCKWGVPCYTINKRNVIMLSALKDCCTLGFFDGPALPDPKQLLVFPGANSKQTKQLRLSSLKEIIEQDKAISDLIHAAIDFAKSGKKKQVEKQVESLPEELLDRFKVDKAYKDSFKKLSPGRQRGYILYFSAPKKPETRLNRIEKYRSQILNGLGFHDKYK